MKQSHLEGRTRQARWGAGALVLALTVATFLPVLRNDFVNWDDAENFLRNPYYRGLRWANIRWMFTSAHMGHYIPVTWLTLGLDYVLWGMNPWGYHLTAILLHATNALLFYLLAYWLLKLGFAPASAAPAVSRAGTEEPGSAGDGGSNKALVFGAIVAGLIFSVHPLRVESVAWITERRDLLAGLFSILAVLAYLRAFDRGALGRLQAGWYWTSVGLFVLALLSKSIVVGLPVVLLALDLYPLRRRRLRALLTEKAPFLFASAMVSLFMLVLAAREDLMADVKILGVFPRFSTSAYSLLFYLLKTVVPWPLSPLYELHYPVRPLSAKYLVSGVTIAVISIAVIVARRRWPAGLTAWVAYLALLLPVSGILQNGQQIAADRYTYLACLGWALIAGAGVTWCWRAKGAGALTPRLASLVLALSATVIIAFAGLSTLQIRVWRDAETLWRYAIWVDPESAFAHHHLGAALSTFGKGEEARAEYAKAIALTPDYFSVKGAFYASLGLELQKEGDTEGAERNYLAALKYAPDEGTALNNLAVIYARRRNDRAAMELFLRLLRIAPHNDVACQNAIFLSARLGVSPGELKTCRSRDGGTDGGAPPAVVDSTKAITLGNPGS